MNNEKASQGAPVEDAERLAEIESICNLEDYQTWNLDLQPHLIWLLNALSDAKREIEAERAIARAAVESLNGATARRKDIKAAALGDATTEQVAGSGKEGEEE